MADLVSIIIPAYNHERYIESCVKSVLAQDYENLELIVIDDGSSDGTFTVLKSLEADCRRRFKRVEMISRPNKGISATMLEGIALAAGVYFYLPASDDQAKPGAVGRLYDFLSQHPDYALAVGDSEIVDSDGKLGGLDENGSLATTAGAIKYRTHAAYMKSLSHGADFSTDDFGSYKFLILGNHIPNGYLIRRKAYDEVGGYRADMPVEDWFLMLQLAKRYTMKYLDEILYSYRCHASNTMKNQPLMLKGLAQTFAAELKWATEEAPDALRRVFESMIQSRTRRHDIFRLGPLIEYYVEKFGMGEYYASRRRVLKICGLDIFNREKVYLPYTPQCPGPVTKDV